MKSPKAVHLLIPIVLLFSLVSLQLFKFRQLESNNNASIPLSHAQHQDQALQQQLTMLLSVPDFGFKNLLADWIFLSFLQYFGDADIRDRLGHSRNPDFFEVILDRDPYFIDSYVYLTNSVSMYSGQPKESIRLLEKGLTSLRPDAPPNSFFVWRHKATDELLFLGDTSAAINSYKTAATWAEQSTDPRANLVVRLSRETVSFLETDPDSKPAQINAWAEVLLRATDNHIKQFATSKIEQLGGTVLVAEKGQVTIRY